jgi:hypothetical protein
MATTVEEQQQAPFTNAPGITEYHSVPETGNAQGVGLAGLQAEAEEALRYQTLDLDLDAGYHDPKSTWKNFLLMLISPDESSANSGQFFVVTCC